MFNSRKNGVSDAPEAQPERRFSPTTPLRPMPPADQSLSIRLGDGSVLRMGNAQHQGRRPYQEDSCGYSNLSDAALIAQKGVLAVLADGMGGLANGKEVSTATVRGMIDFFNSYSAVCRGGSDLLRRAAQVNEEICRTYCPTGKVEAGSTLVCAQIMHGRLHWLCIGDSRMYLRRGGMLYQINEDHDYLNQLMTDAIRD